MLWQKQEVGGEQTRQGGGCRCLALSTLDCVPMGSARCGMARRLCALGDEQRASKLLKSQGASLQPMDPRYQQSV